MEIVNTRNSVNMSLDIILDNTEDAMVRLDNLIQYYDRCVVEQVDVKEVFSTIGFCYLLSASTYIKEFIGEVCLCNKLPLEHRISLVRDLHLQDSFTFLSSMYTKCKDAFLTLPLQIREDTLLFFCNPISNITNEVQYQELMIEFITDGSILPLTRYRFIKKLQVDSRIKKIKKPLKPQNPKDQKLEKEQYDLEVERVRVMVEAHKTKLLIPALSHFIGDSTIPIDLRLLSAQFLYSLGADSIDLKCGGTPAATLTGGALAGGTVREFLYGIGSDPNQTEDVRADAYDILLKYATGDEEKGSIRILLKLLGGNGLGLYGNSQNVHSTSIEKSVEQLINRLGVKIPDDGTPVEVEFEKIKSGLGKRICDDRIRYDLELALQRIELDEAVYGVQNMTLKTILCKLYAFILGSEFKEELISRLVEELLESSNKCSSGFVSRLVNVLSGYHQDMTLTISFEEEIISKIENELNKQIQQLGTSQGDEEIVEIVHPTLTSNHKIERLTQDEYKDLIIEEMCVDNHKYTERDHFLHFFRARFSTIRATLYQEYKGLISDEEFDRCSGKAISFYEGFGST